jgi:hypothetical protein
VVGKELGLGARDVVELLLQDVGDLRVQLLASRPEQALIRSVLHEGMLEAVGHGRWRAAAKHQFGRDQLVQGGRELAVHWGDGGKQPRAELAPDHRSDLGDFLDRRQAIQAGHQRVVQGRRDRERRQRADQLKAITAFVQQTRFDDRFGQLFNE